MLDKINKTEYDLAQSALDKILSEPVEKIELTDGIPPITDIEDSNKVFKGKLSILFVDMRNSTDLTDELKAKKMVKIYRSFIRAIIQAIRYSGGYSRQFAGDGIMGVFQDSCNDDLKEVSSQKAVRAGRYIISLIDYCLNPLLDKYMDGLRISCGIGICTGTIMVTKAGMRGKEADDSSENELGIIWVGSTTNNANRYCSLANGGEIFIDKSTFVESGQDTNQWAEVSKLKGTQVYDGYLSADYYLEMDENINADPIKIINSKIDTNSFVQMIFEETKKEALELIDEIAQKSKEVSIKISEINKKEESLRTKETIISQKESDLISLQNKLNEKQNMVDSKDLQNKVDEYYLNKNIFHDTFCKDALVVALGKEFWIGQISTMINLGKKIGKSEVKVKSDLDCYLVRIYDCFKMYEESYDALCIQAEYGTWLNTTIVEDIIRKSEHWARLKGILEKRINPGNDKTKNDFLDAYQKMKNMGY